MKKKIFKIAVFFDNRVGHLKQTEGILKELSKLTDIEVLYKEEVFPSFKNDIRDIFKYFFILVTKKKPKRNKFDIIIGTGAHTHIPMLIFRRKFGGKIATCMIPNFPVKYFIDFCFIPKQKNHPKGKNIFSTIGAPNLCVFEKNKNKKKGLILVGGVDKYHIWNSEKVILQIKEIIKKEENVHWFISSSRRTPKDCVNLLLNLAKKTESATFFKGEETNKGWLEEKYKECEKVWITSDSNSMTYEALSAGCKVGIIFIEWKKKRNSFQRSLDYLTENDYIVSFEKWLKEGKMPQGIFLNESKKCAETILKKL